LSGGSVRVGLTFIGGIPDNFHVTGIGSAEVTVTLPGTAPGPNVRQQSYPGGGPLASLTLNVVASELDVGLH
jgi:hypothetical protein